MKKDRLASSSSIKPDRLLSLDAIKGGAILLVLWGHIYRFAEYDTSTLYYSYVVQYLEAVHMPFFMLIAGFFATKALDLTRQGILHYWRDKLVRLVLPAVLWHLMLMTWIWGIPSLGGILGKEYWFTLTLFIYFGVFYVQRLLIDGMLNLIPRRGRLWTEAGLHLLLTVGLVYLSESSSFEGLQWLRYFSSVSTAFPCLYPYFVLGYLMKRLSLLDYLQTQCSGVVSFVLLILSLGVFRHQELEVPYLSYGLFHSYRLMALASFAFLVYGMTALTDRGGWISKGLVFLGQWSLPIYLTHYFFLPHVYGIRAYLQLIPPTGRLMLELAVYSLGTLMTLLPTLAVIWLLKRNPYLDYALYGEVGRLKR